MYDVITVGSATVDVFAKTKVSELIKITDSRGETELLAYPTGSKILIGELEFTTGGGATNTAVALARLGHKVACISKMGARGNAEKILRALKREKIDTSLAVCSKKGRTGYSIILDSLKHDRTILAFKGSNNELKFSEINKRKLKTKWFYFSTMMEESFKTLEKLSEFAEKNKIKIAFNTSEYLAKKGPKFLKNILSRTTLFVLNKEEAGLIVGKGNERELLKKLHNLGPKIVVITDGKHGVHASNGKGIYFLQPHKVKVVETTGAGDAFASSFLSGLIKKNDIKFALKLASANAESVISHHGAKNKLLTYKEALADVRENPTKLRKTYKL
ncbi:carbohydrate kinase family protein [Candidatus Woesearchaeota archaeon]|nr:carbohydrate kinase family protein [Candidatus Woesearchaeota archaeon]